ncbi:hypothetical protein QFW96_28215 [Saccharopolyspora sp. TS4A08]|uniref:DUF4404 family protein n=1 Tax=Saccharopolyspora ipomoeae TaxID=3042027 RepID=A0ABT6PX09_9PSEU|nr:hypothetical protein [Saccharopolyspora sp. TS4A08]MDI2032537.1 hypothetical protein [Saccharopolyspora sp. TS4A08]
MPDREAETTSGAGLLARSAPATPSPRDTTDHTDRLAALDQARVYLNSLVDVLDQHPAPSLDLDEAKWRLAEIVDELAVEQPSPPRVQSRWIRLVPVLREVRPDIPFPALTHLIRTALGVA